MNRGFLRQLLVMWIISIGAIAHMDAQNMYKIKSLEFNSREYDEFAPVIYDKGLVFNTHRMQHVYKSEVDLNEKAINDLYYSRKLSAGNWGPPIFFSNELNTRSHEGKCTFTKDGNTIYFTRFQNDSSGYIYKANKSGGIWGNQVLISLNSSNYRIKDPCLSTDGKKLFFSSMAKEGMGGYDIYVSYFERGDWSTPKNLGPNVNTSGNEVAPFIQSNGKLYFSSNKLPGLGQYDIFYTRELNGRWIKPKHLSEPVNSSRDDLYYCSDAGDTTGYLSSNRNHSFDIFSFSLTWPKFEDCRSMQKNEYTYVFSEKGSVDNDTTTWLYEWDFGDGNKSRGKKAEAEHTYSHTGQYLVQLNVVDTLTGEILLNEDSYPFNVADIEQAFISSPDTIFLEDNVKFDASLTNLPSYKKIDKYYWDFGNEETEVGITVYHSFYIPGKSSVKLCVMSAPNEAGKVLKSCVNKDIVVIQSP